jgi:hypothetical protein
MYQKKVIGILICILFILSSVIITPNIFVKAVKADLTTGLVGYWNFDEGDGTIAYDSSGYGNDGTITGASWTTSGIIDGGLEFDGSGDYIIVTDSASLDITNEITISIWVKFYSISSSEPPFIIYKRGDGGNSDEIYKLGVDDYGIGEIDFRINSNPVQGGSLTTLNWYHIAATFNGTTKIIYLDANPVADEIQSVTIQTSNRNLYIGADHDSTGFNQFFDGVIDDVRIYERALSSNEIISLFQLGGTNNPPNPPSNPNPASSATGVDVNAELSWSCTDPDGNPLTYDVYFGTNPNPSLASSYQTGNTYKPATMSYLTPYYWRIVAWDNLGESRSSPIWSFTTTDQPNNPPVTPSRPSGPAAGWTGVYIEFSSSSGDPDLDQIKYGWDWNSNDVVDEWTVLMDSNSTCYRSRKWNTPGSYNIKVKVKDSKGAVSGWSEVKSINILLLNNEPNSPNQPEGPTDGETNVEYEYTVSTTDPDNDKINYGWDWNGDYIIDEWSSYSPSGFTDIRKHSWNTEGIYNVQVKAEDEHGYQSDWSLPLIVEIFGNDNYPPRVKIISPEQNDFVTGLINIYGSASDENGNETLTMVEVKIDDKSWENVTGTNYWNYSWNTVIETEGIHTIYARSFDGDLYSNYSIVNVTVQHDLPEIIINVKGGFGLSATIVNNGTAPANNLSWSIDIEPSIGLVLSGSYNSDVIDILDVNETETIQASNLRGIGLITINVQAADASKQATAFLLGPLVLRVNEI